MARSPVDEARERRKTFGEARLALLRARQASLTDIAQSVDRSVSIVSRVNGGQRRSEMIEREIARRLGLTAEEAFPELHGGESRPSERPDST